jgi:two-component system sensor histidine kinase/response regulator
LFSVLCVKDNGADFDMEDAPRLFQVLERLHDADEFEGTGIGLVTCQKILKRHGGKAWMTGKDR